MLEKNKRGLLTLLNFVPCVLRFKAEKDVGGSVFSKCTAYFHSPYYSNNGRDRLVSLKLQSLYVNL
jgi:hypothetical protein